MTGFGDARGQNDRLSVSVEVRAVNNRFLKLTTKLPERFQLLEAEIERVVRDSISRGTVNLLVRIDALGAAPRYRLDAAVLRSYWQQLAALNKDLGATSAECLGNLVDLPGVVTDSSDEESDVHHDWPLIESTLRAALAKFQGFR